MDFTGPIAAAIATNTAAGPDSGLLIDVADRGSVHSQSVLYGLPAGLRIQRSHAHRRLRDVRDHIGAGASPVRLDLRLPWSAPRVADQHHFRRHRLGMLPAGKRPDLVAGGPGGAGRRP